MIMAIPIRMPPTMPKVAVVVDIRGCRYSCYAERFETLVRETLAELYDPSTPFRQCADADTCKFCDFNVICKR